MSITLNGSALGTQQIRSLAKTDSWQSPSEYVDPTTGKVYRAETLGELLEQLDQAGVPLFDNEEMRKRGLTTPGGKAPGGDDDSQWERLLIDLSAYQNPERAREIILDALRNPKPPRPRIKGKAGWRITTCAASARSSRTKSTTTTSAAPTSWPRCTPRRWTRPATV